MAHPDLAAEQEYLDRAHEELDRMRDSLIQGVGAAATEESRVALEKWSKHLTTLVAAKNAAAPGDEKTG